MKVVINRQGGGFGLSKAAYERMGLEWDGYGYEFSFCDYGYVAPPGSYTKRTDPKLVKCVEELGAAANGQYAKLEVIDIPDDVGKWTITKQNGLESVVEITGRVWPAPGRKESDK